MRRKAANSDRPIWSISSDFGCVKHKVDPVIQGQNDICQPVVIIFIGSVKFVVVIIHVEIEQNAVLARTWVAERVATVFIRPK